MTTDAVNSDAGGPSDARSRRPCPTCGGEAASDGRDRPFCSRRCRLIDLGRWFNEEYAVPGEDAFSLDMPGFSSESADDDVDRR